MPFITGQTPYIRTHSGVMFDVTNPQIDDIHIEDIAHALSHLCRFGGHTPKFYSVAQHSYLCARMAPVKDQLVTLLHDASEAYLMDLPSPIKSVLRDYAAIEDHLQQVICKKFDLPYPFPEIVHEIDHAMLAQEWNELIMVGNASKFNCWGSEHARHMFLDLFFEIRLNR